MPASLCVDEFFAYHFNYSASNSVHPPYPRHLVGGFELFCHTFLFGVFFYQPRKESLCLFFGVGEMGIELAGSEQIVIQDFVVLLQISESALSPYADRVFFFGGKVRLGRR